MNSFMFDWTHFSAVEAQLRDTSTTRAEPYKSYFDKLCRRNKSTVVTDIIFVIRRRNDACVDGPSRKQSVYIIVYDNYNVYKYTYIVLRRVILPLGAVRTIK